METLSTSLKILGDPTRLRILELLSKEKALVSSLIATKLHIRSSVTSHHLRILHDHGLIIGQKNGRYCMYVLNTPKLMGVLEELRNLTS